MNTNTQNIALTKWLTPKMMALPIASGGYEIAEQTQSKLRMAHKIPFAKVGKFIRYSREELDKWIENHTIVSAGL